MSMEPSPAEVTQFRDLIAERLGLRIGKLPVAYFHGI